MRRIVPRVLAGHVRPAVTARRADSDCALPAAARPARHGARDELAALDARLRTVEQRLTALAAELPAVASVRTVPGAGLRTATAHLGCVGDAHRVPTARFEAPRRGCARVPGFILPALRNGDVEAVLSPDDDFRTGAIGSHG